MLTTISEWQEAFKKQPKIWYVEADHESTGNFYDTKEGAEIEARWLNERGQKAKVYSSHIHSLDLAKSRWQ